MMKQEPFYDPHNLHIESQQLDITQELWIGDLLLCDELNRYNVDDTVQPCFSLWMRGTSCHLSPNRKTVYSPNNWGTCLATHGASAGYWYYETTVLSLPESKARNEAGDFRVGFSTRRSDWNSPIGMDETSYGVSPDGGIHISTPLLPSPVSPLSSSPVPPLFPINIKKGDHISLLLGVHPKNALSKEPFENLDELQKSEFITWGFVEDPSSSKASLASLTVFVNGSLVAFLPSLPKGLHHPAVSVRNGAEIEIRLSPPFKYDINALLSSAIRNLPPSMPPPFLKYHPPLMDRLIMPCGDMTLAPPPEILRRWWCLGKAKRLPCLPSVYVKNHPSKTKYWERRWVKWEKEMRDFVRRICPGEEFLQRESSHYGYECLKEGDTRSKAGQSTGELGLSEIFDAFQRDCVLKQILMKGDRRITLERLRLQLQGEEDIKKREKLILRLLSDIFFDFEDYYLFRKWSPRWESSLRSRVVDKESILNSYEKKIDLLLENMRRARRNSRMRHSKKDDYFNDDLLMQSLTFIPRKKHRQIETGDGDLFNEIKEIPKKKLRNDEGVPVEMRSDSYLHLPSSPLQSTLELPRASQIVKSLVSSLSPFSPSSPILSPRKGEMKEKRELPDQWIFLSWKQLQMEKQKVLTSLEEERRQRRVDKEEKERSNGPRLFEEFEAKGEEGEKIRQQREKEGEEEVLLCDSGTVRSLERLSGDQEEIMPKQNNGRMNELHGCISTRIPRENIPNSGRHTDHQYKREEREEKDMVGRVVRKQFEDKSRRDPSNNEIVDDYRSKDCSLILNYLTFEESFQEFNSNVMRYIENRKCHFYWNLLRSKKKSEKKNSVMNYILTDVARPAFDSFLTYPRHCIPINSQRRRDHKTKYESKRKKLGDAASSIKAVKDYEEVDLRYKLEKAWREEGEKRERKRSERERRIKEERLVEYEDRNVYCDGREFIVFTKTGPYFTERYYIGEALRRETGELEERRGKTNYYFLDLYRQLSEHIFDENNANYQIFDEQKNFHFCEESTMHHFFISHQKLMEIFILFYEKRLWGENNNHTLRLPLRTSSLVIFDNFYHLLRTGVLTQNFHFFDAGNKAEERIKSERKEEVSAEEERAGDHVSARSKTLKRKKIIEDERKKDERDETSEEWERNEREDKAYPREQKHEIAEDANGNGSRLKEEDLRREEKGALHDGGVVVATEKGEVKKDDVEDKEDFANWNQMLNIVSSKIKHFSHPICSPFSITPSSLSTLSPLVSSQPPSKSYTPPQKNLIQLKVETKGLRAPRMNAPPIPEALQSWLLSI